MWAEPSNALLPSPASVVLKKRKRKIEKMPRHKRRCVPRNSESTLHSKQLLMVFACLGSALRVKNADAIGVVLMLEGKHLQPQWVRIRISWCCESWALEWLQKNRGKCCKTLLENRKV